MRILDWSTLDDRGRRAALARPAPFTELEKLDNPRIGGLGITREEFDGWKKLGF